MNCEPATLGQPDPTGKGLAQLSDQRPLGKGRMTELGTDVAAEEFDGGDLGLDPVFRQDPGLRYLDVLGADCDGDLGARVMTVRQAGQRQAAHVELIRAVIAPLKKFIAPMKSATNRVLGLS